MTLTDPFAGPLDSAGIERARAESRHKGARNPRLARLTRSDRSAPDGECLAGRSTPPTRAYARVELR